VAQALVDGWLLWRKAERFSKVTDSSAQVVPSGERIAAREEGSDAGLRWHKLFT
jgi:hypothetical protein